MSSDPVRPVTRPQPGAAPQVKGRGTGWALAHRFSRDQREGFDDGWGTLEQAVQEQALPPATQVLEEQVKSILTGNDSPDIGFDLSINPYRGCEHVIPQKQLCVQFPFFAWSMRYASTEQLVYWTSPCPAAHSQRRSLEESAHGAQTIQRPMTQA